MTKKKIVILIIILIIAVLAGVLWYTNRGEKDPLVNKNSNGNKTEEINTSDWQTYQNEEYGFEIKYPDGWITNENEDIISIYYPGWREDMPEGGGGVDIRITEKQIDKFIEEYNSSDDFSKIVNQSDYVLDNVECFKLTGSTAIGINSNFIFIKKDKINYIISFHDFDKDHVNIISTFKFVDKKEIDISGWQTYQNEEYGFELKYPGEWNESAFGMEGSTREQYESFMETFIIAFNNEGGFSNSMFVQLFDDDAIEKRINESIDKIEKKMINNFSYYIHQGDLETFFIIPIEKDKNILLIVRTTNKNKNLFLDNIISSFKFIK